jgi:hypothetical protein
MTKRERAVWLLAERQASRYRPALQNALLASWRDLTKTLPLAQIERLIAAGAIDELAGIVEDTFGRIVEARYLPVSRETFGTAARGALTRMPTVLQGTRYDLLNPLTINAVRTLETRALSTLTTEVGNVVRQAVADGITRGVGPRTTARAIRDAVGLAPNQLAEVENFRLALTRIGESKDALNYRARDKRFDATLNRIRKEGGELTTDQIDRMTDAYRQRRIALNAETHARTTALDAQRAGNRNAWDTAMTEQGVDRSLITKRWVATMDKRTRDEHAAADGTIVQFDELYPYDGGVMVPGEGTYNCRCVELIRVDIARAAA